MKLPAQSLLLWWACILLLARVYGQPAVDVRTIALVGAKIYPSPTVPAMEDGVVLIRAGKIAAVGSSKMITVSKGDSVLDCRGLTLTAAFWNCHVAHVFDIALAHTAPEDRLPWSADMIGKMLRAHVALIPTLKLWKDILVQEGDTAWSHEKFMLTAEQQLHAFDKAGGTILFGTDVGYITDYATGDEFTLLAASGLTWSRILGMLTTAPAQRFGLKKRTGQIVVGLDADIVLLRGDPAADVQAFDEVELTILHGKVIYKRSQ